MVTLCKKYTIYTVIKRFTGKKPDSRVLISMKGITPKPPTNINKTVTFNTKRNPLDPSNNKQSSTTNTPNTTKPAENPIIFDPNTTTFDSSGDKIHNPQEKNSMTFPLLTFLREYVNASENLEKQFKDALEKDKENKLSLEVLKTILKHYQKKTTMTQDDLDVLNILKKRFNNILPENYHKILTRDQEEYQRLCQLRAITKDNSNDDFLKELKEFFSLDTLSRTFTLENMLYEIERNQKGLALITKYANNLNEAELLEILRRLGIIKNPDAAYLSDMTPAKTIIVNEGEGFKLLSQVYTIFKTIGGFKTDSGLLPDVDKVLVANQKGDIVVGITNRTHDPNTLLLSGTDLHMVIAIEDPSDPNFYLIEAMFTSTKDDSTIMVAKQQQSFSVNPTEDLLLNKQNVDNVPKPQMVRFVKTLIRISKSEFTIMNDATNFLKNFKDEGDDLSVLEKIILGVTKQATIFGNAPIETCTNFTRENLLALAIKSFTDAINAEESKLKQLQQELSGLTETERKTKLKDRQTEGENAIKLQKKAAYISTLPQEVKLFIEIQERLSQLATKQAKQARALRKKSEDALAAATHKHKKNSEKDNNPLNKNEK